LSTPLPLRSLIEEFQSLFYRALLLIAIIFPCRNHADRFPSRDPLQLVSRPDSVLVGDGFGHCQLQLACNLRHILTIARILSLLKILRLDPKLYEQLRNRVLRQDGWKCQSCGKGQRAYYPTADVKGTACAYAPGRRKIKVPVLAGRNDPDRASFRLRSGDDRSERCRFDWTRPRIGR